MITVYRYKGWLNVVKDTSLSSKILDIFVYTSLLIILAITLLPILNVMSISLSSSKAVFYNQVTFYPVGLNFEAYKNIFGGKTVPRAFLNSTIYSVTGTVISVMLNASIAYPMSKKDLPLKKLYWAILIIPMYISGGMIPSFILIRSLGLYDTMWALILPGAIGTGTIIVMRTFFMGLPDELEEAATIDGAGHMTIFLRIILPLSKPILATMGLFAFVGHWNNYFGPLIYIQTQSKNPIQVILQQIIMQEQFAQDLMKQGIAGADLLETISGSGSEYDSVVWVYKKSVFDSLGLEPPKTVDEMYETLMKIKQEKVKDLIFSHRYNVLLSLFIAFGTTSGSWVNPITNKFEFGVETPEFREALKFARKLYKSGLLAQDFPTWTQTQFDTAVGKNQIVYAYAYANSPDGWEKLEAETDPNSDWEMSPYYLKADENKPAVFIKEQPWFSWGIAITDKTPDEKMERIAEMIDWFSTREGNDFLWFGPEGVTYDIIDDYYVFKEGYRDPKDPTGHTALMWAPFQEEGFLINTIAYSNYIVYSQTELGYGPAKPMAKSVH